MRHEGFNHSARPAGARPPAGFTLIELLVSIGIIIFVLSLSILAVGPALRTAGTRDAARRLRATLDAAKVRAIQQRRAVRFEAQRASSGGQLTQPEQWGVTPNAGDPTFEWYTLPELVTVQTNAGSSDSEGHGGYRVVNAIAITFAADASVKAVSYRSGSDLTNWTEVNLGVAPNPFRIRLHTVRDASNDEVNQGVCFIEITPLTGLLTSFGYEEYKDDDTGKVRNSDLPKP